MSFQTKANEVLAKARRVDEIAEELHVLLRALGTLDQELLDEVKSEARSGVRPNYAAWVALENTAKREINEAVHGGVSWQSLPTVAAIFEKAWGQVLPDYAAQAKAEGRAK